MGLVDSNKRQQRRLPARPLGTSKPPKMMPYRILDISRTGCLVESRKPIGRVGSMVFLDLPLPTRTEDPVVRARIVWERVGPERAGGARFRYGLSFRQIDGASHQALNLYLDYLKRDQHVSLLDEAWRKARKPKSGSSPSVLCEETESAAPSISEKPARGRTDSGNAFVR